MPLQQPGESPAAMDFAALRKALVASCGDALSERDQSASPAAVSSTSEAAGVPAETVEASTLAGPQQHAAAKLDILDTSSKQLLAFFDKDLLARGHAAMTTAADEGTCLSPCISVCGP